MLTEPSKHYFYPELATELSRCALLRGVRAMPVV